MHNASTQSQANRDAGSAHQLASQLDALDAHIAAHGQHLPDPHLPVRLGLIALSWAALFAAGFALDIPRIVGLATLAAVPVMLLPELVFTLVRRRLPLRPGAYARRTQLITGIQRHHDHLANTRPHHEK